ncbi:hypothetical protein [Andreprevotia sp. IGB-42]|nr:hypothetical protein [Andreprevotia sp. IGB-42]
MNKMHAWLLHILHFELIFADFIGLQAGTALALLLMGLIPLFAMSQPG